jgi:hypothetical protein
VFYLDPIRMHVGCFDLVEGRYVETGVVDPLENKPWGWRPRWWVRQIRELENRGVVFEHAYATFTDDSEDPPELGYLDDKYEEAMEKRRVLAERGF